MKSITTVTRKFEFDAAHRVLGHKGNCKNLHGHHYVAEVKVVGPQQLDPLGMVIDFGILKEKIGAWIDANWDHNIILCSQDPMIVDIAPFAQWKKIYGDKQPFIMPREINPTAEAMAQFLLEESNTLLFGSHILVFQVRLYETPKCSATYTLTFPDGFPTLPNME